MWQTILGFFSGGTSIFASMYIKIIGILLMVGMLGGALWYVDHLRSSLKIAEANVATVESSLKAEQDKNTHLLLDIKVMQDLTKQVSTDWTKIDQSSQVLQSTVKKTVKKVVAAKKAEVAAPKPDPAVQQEIEKSINTLSHAGVRCDELVTTSPTDEDKKNPDLQNVCPELLK